VSDEKPLEQIVNQDSLEQLSEFKQRSTIEEYITTALPTLSEHNVATSDTEIKEILTLIEKEYIS
jgi:hypothetical protein